MSDGTDNVTLGRIDENIKNILTSIGEMKERLKDVSEGHADLDRRVTTIEADLRHANENLQREQERQRENARRAAEVDARELERKRQEEQRLAVEMTKADALRAAAAKEEKDLRAEDSKSLKELQRNMYWFTGVVAAAGAGLSFILHLLVK